MTVPPEKTGPPEDHNAADYVEFRPLMFSIAYRMTGSISDAEDIVQEAFLRLTRVLRDGASIDSPKAYLATATTRLAISHLRSARVRRESYVGAWLPEPLLTGSFGGRTRSRRARGDVRLAVDGLPRPDGEPDADRTRGVPAARGVRLRIPGDRGHHRQVRAELPSDPRPGPASRRRAKPRFETSRAQSEEVARRFFEAAAGGDLAALLELLAPDVTMVGDGGGKAWAAARPFHGPQQVARFMLGLARRGPKMGARVELAWVNGQPGAVTYDAEGPCHQRLRPRHRRRPGARGPVRDQPRQAAPPGPGV